jgi:two-component system CheB/CheR fusion protein
VIYPRSGTAAILATLGDSHPVLRRMSSTPLDGLATLIEYLKRNRSCDFGGYKPASLERRIRRRMQSIGVRAYADYVDYLEAHPEEFEILFSTILINVTAFFRDTATWDLLAERLIPEIVRQKDSGEQIRVWSAGCATGEEAYTLAMLFAETTGATDYKQRLKIYATDIDEEVLARARLATYDAREVAGVPPKLLSAYFEESDHAYTFRKDLRRNVIFGRHDLIQDAPISHVDLLVCRNTLMYFDVGTQSRILRRFHSALNDGGILVLGRAETPLTQANTFMPIDLTRRTSARVPRASSTPRERLVRVAPRSTNDELEITNEELQSTVEELARTNEELRSTRAELEAMNEELRSTNEELATINQELRQRSAELE